MGCLLIKHWWEIEIKYIISNHEKKRDENNERGFGRVRDEGGRSVCVRVSLCGGR